MSEQQAKEPRDRIGMGKYYHLGAGAIYLFMAFMLYKNSPASWDEGLVHGLAIVAALYGLFRVGRGVMQILR